MDTQKKEILCQLHEIGILICKLKDERKLKHCDKKVKDLHSYLKKGKSKTMRKSKSQSKSKYDIYKSMIPNTPPLISDTPPVSDTPTVSTPMISDVDRSMNQPVLSMSDPFVKSPATSSLSLPSSEYTDPTSASFDDDYTEKPSVLKTLPSQPYISDKKPLNL